MVGWSLGNIEAILITILAGFSVDYVTHLGHAYSHNYGSKEERIAATFAEMGGPVIHGVLVCVCEGEKEREESGGLCLDACECSEVCMLFGEVTLAQLVTKIQL
jgi:hypothetical protein